MVEITVNSLENAFGTACESIVSALQDISGSNLLSEVTSFNRILSEGITVEITTESIVATHFNDIKNRTIRKVSGRDACSKELDLFYNSLKAGISFEINFPQRQLVISFSNSNVFSTSTFFFKHVLESKSLSLSLVHVDLIRRIKAAVKELYTHC